MKAERKMEIEIGLQRRGDVEDAESEERSLDSVPTGRNDNGLSFWRREAPFAKGAQGKEDRESVR
jgi:hypothetical protein